ncbi:MAG: hypothetical protein KF799_10660 [Bdellovibrionales bacterium]|nr:hypothetical protein [Bdellovibrionales bacterium]
MTRFRSMTLALVASAVLISACERKSNTPPEQNRQPTPEVTKTEPARPQTQTPPPTRTSDGSTPQQNQERSASQNSPPPYASLPPPTSTSRPSDDNAPFYERGYNTVKDQVGKAATYVEDQLTSVGKGIQDTTRELTESTQTLINPTPANELGKDSIDVIHQQALQQRDREVEQLKIAMAQSQPARADVVKEVINPNDEMSELLTAVISERDPERADAYSALLIDEIFNEPDQARAKVMKLQLGLRRLSENNLYDKDVAARTAYLQAQLDDRIRVDGSGELLRDGLWVAGTSLALGAFAGFHGFEGARHFVHEFSPRRTLTTAAEKVSSSYKTARNKVSSLFPYKASSEAGPTARYGLRRSISNLPLGSQEIVRRDITALGVDANIARGLGLDRAQHASAGFQQFEPTNMPGLKYAVVDQWEDMALNGNRRIVFSMSRWDTLSPRPVIVASRELPAAEADDIVRQIRFQHPDEGGKDFLMVADSTGAITPTRLTVEEAEQSGVPIAKAKTTRSRSKKSVAEAKYDGDIPLTTPVGATPAVQTTEASADEVVSIAAAQPTFGQRARAGVAEAAQKTRNVANQAVSSLKPKLKNFDLPWATAVTVGSAVPLYAFMMEGYNEGRRYGEGHEALYLESLIPKDQVNRLTVELTNQDSR